MRSSVKVGVLVSLMMVFIVLAVTGTASAATYNPSSWLASMYYNGGSYLDAEKFFPVRGSANRLINTYATYCNWNGYPAIDVEDASETYIMQAITSSAYGATYEGGTISSAHPSNQRPSVYWRQRNLSATVCPSCGTTHSGWSVYEYWFYYPVNDAYWPFDHEHDWEKYYIYFLNNYATAVRLSCHSSFNVVDWVVLESGGLVSGTTHMKCSIEGGQDYTTGSHAFEPMVSSSQLQDGVCISYGGTVSPRNGWLTMYSSQPWVIFSNDPNASGVTSYTLSPSTYYMDDPDGPGGAEYGGGMPAPWNRVDWDSPPGPYCAWTL
jgi:hypothetical protein